MRCRVRGCFAPRGRKGASGTLSCRFSRKKRVPPPYAKEKHSSVNHVQTFPVGLQ